MDPLKDLLKIRLENHRLGAAAHAAAVLQAANSWLAEHLPSLFPAVRAFRLDQGRLYLRVENAVAAQELWGAQSKLLRFLRSSFGENALQRMVLRVVCLEDGTEPLAPLA